MEHLLSSDCDGLTIGCIHVVKSISNMLIIIVSDYFNNAGQNMSVVYYFVAV
jgi:hypothetical protein